jgi:hypothetical protein
MTPDPLIELMPSKSPVPHGSGLAPQAGRAFSSIMWPHSFTDVFWYGQPGQGTFFGSGILSVGFPVPPSQRLR